MHMASGVWIHISRVKCPLIASRYVFQQLSAVDTTAFVAAIDFIL